MLLNYILLLTIISSIYSLKLVFDGEELIYNTTKITDIDNKYQICNKNFNELVINEYFCVNRINTNVSKPYQMIKELVELYVGYFMIPPNDITELYTENKYLWDKIRDNYDKFYFESINFIKIILKKLLIYYLEKFDDIYNSTQVILNSHIMINQTNEEIIFPDEKSIRYFTSDTINKYSNCIEFIDSLDKMTCFTLKKEILNNYVEMALSKLKN